MINRILTVIVAFLCVLTLVSCGNANENSGDTSSSESTDSGLPNYNGGGTSDREPEEYGSGILVLKTGEFFGSDYDVYPVTLYVDENGNENVEIENFAEVDFSRFKASDSTGSIDINAGTIVYTVSDGIINEGSIEDVVSNTMIISQYYEEDDGTKVSIIYVYVQ